MKNRLSHLFNQKKSQRKIRTTGIFEQLEERQLLSGEGLLNYPIDVPLITYSSNGTQSYNAATQLLSVNAGAVSFLGAQTPAPKFTDGQFNFNIKIDNNGHLIGGVQGDDLVISGTIVINGTTYSGVLLTGEILDFGYEGNGATETSSFEFVFDITGGSLASFYDNKDFDVRLSAEPLATEPSGFVDFSTNFKTVAKGTSGSTDLTESASLGDYVWNDDGNGIQDAGETGVKGVTVSLYGDLDDNGVIDFTNELIGTTITDDNGYYEFTDLDAGVQYQVKFDKPAKGNFTVALQGDAALDSDANVNTGLSGFVTLKPGEHNPTIDAGIVGGTGSTPKASLGDFVWHDTGNSSHDVNGIQDADELGIGNVKVELLNNKGQVIATTYTNASGYYLFENLDAGSYRTRIAASNFATGGVLNGWYATLQNVGNNDAKDSDGDRYTYTSQLVTLAAGTQDLSLDFGFFKTGVELDKTAPLTAKPGQTITYTFTITNTGDVEIDGGKLYDPLLSRCGQPIWCGTIKAGQTVTFSVLYTIPCYYGCGDLTNTATFTGSPDDPGRLCLPKLTDSDTVTTVVSNKPSNNNGGGCNNNPPKNNCGGGNDGGYGNQCNSHTKHRPSNKHCFR